MNRPALVSPKRAAKTEALLAAAERLVIERGGDFEMGELAREAGVSNGLAYHYFGSKDGLIAAVVDQFYERYSAVIDAPADTNIAWPVRERERLSAAIAFLYTDPFAPIAFGGLAHPRAFEREGELRAGLSARAARNVRSGQKRGQVSQEVDPELAGAAIIGAVHAAMMVAMQSNPRPDPAQVAEQLWAIIQGAVGLPAR